MFLLFVLFSVRVIPRCFNNAEVWAPGRSIHDSWCCYCLSWSLSSSHRVRGRAQQGTTTGCRAVARLTQRGRYAFTQVAAVLREDSEGEHAHGVQEGFGWLLALNTLSSYRTLFAVICQQTMKHNLRLFVVWIHVCWFMASLLIIYNVFLFYVLMLCWAATWFSLQIHAVKAAVWPFLLQGALCGCLPCQGSLLLWEATVMW